MLQGFFNYDNPIWRFVGRLGDMILLNVLWILCSLPIVTIGASTTALYYCTLKIVRNEDDGDIKMFFKSFKLNFKQATIIWIPMLLLGMLLVFDFNFFGTALAGAGIARILLQGLTIAMIVIWIFVFTYVWPLLSRFDNTVKNTVTNAAYMSIRYLGSTLSMLISDVIVIAVGYVALYYMAWITAFMVLMGYPLLAWINSTMLDHIFEKYMPKTDPSKDKEVRPILQDLNLDGTLKEGSSSETERDLENLKNKDE
ncbi:YesL family protein [Oribacterium sp. FC2011]|uniref:YesL family protein n=1 Tax=Oribacterium sp. FC2011 TaxID=1408311 RepID=UPI0004E17399|nr:YesL family protein [Oribacterium sp. FC2011]